jgi:apolipoprotein N-acyltransferase
MKKIHLAGISVLGGILLSLGWPENGFPGLLFIGFIPFIFIEEQLFRHPGKFGRFAFIRTIFPGLLVWNVLTTWWVWLSTPAGSVSAFILNALLMTGTLGLYHKARKNLPVNKGPWMLVFFWIAFEYFHHNWEGTWPWLSLGNGFAGYYKWVQWYEYTGIFGGTLWVLLVNIMLFKALRTGLEKQPLRRLLMPLLTSAVIIAVPIIISSYLYLHFTEKPWPVDVVVVQPNIDPYNEQYELPPLQILDKNLSLAREKLDSAVDFVVSPESAIQENIWEKHLHDSKSIKVLKTFTAENPNTGVVIGSSTFNEYNPGEELSSSARKFKTVDKYYDAFNTAIYIDRTGEVSLHHKSKLTPGVERMPYSWLMQPLEGLAINLGGTVGSLGTDKERVVFTRKEDGLKIAPVICYESVFGEYMTQYIRKGASLIFVITNDGWWGDTPGYRQHFTFSRLRAIELRRSIARSANTGRSAFINQRGDAFQETAYWEPGVIRQTINANDKMTFYSRHGDYIGRISSLTAAILILIAIVNRLKNRTRVIHAP